MEEYKWFEESRQKRTEPISGDMGIVTLPVRVLFIWSDKIVADVDEENNPVEYKSGYIMTVIPDQTFVYNGEPIHFMSHCQIEK